MSGPEPGIYAIELAADPNPLIGVDLPLGVILPVVTNGEEKIWHVEKTDETLYGLTIKGTGGRPLYIQGDGDRLVGTDKPPGGIWVINGQKGGPYTIQVPGERLPPTVWTVQNPDAQKDPVKLEVLELRVPHNNQQWFFRPILRE